jgi:hypothetical protein
MCGIGVPNGAPPQVPVGAFATHVNTTTNNPGFLTHKSRHRRERASCYRLC